VGNNIKGKKKVLFMNNMNFFDEVVRLLSKLLFWILIQSVAASPNIPDRLGRLGHSKTYLVARVT
jgi:hypothetical protein